jgi:NitT/TauT family transport system permease protein
MLSISSPEANPRSTWQRRPWLSRTLAIGLALLVWQVAARLVHSSLLLVSPWTVLMRLTVLAGEPFFWQAIGYSLVRIMAGFLLALLAGSLLAAGAARLKALEVLLWPYMAAIKATPVASFIILCLIWLNAASLSVFISFLMVLPIIYSSVLQGLRSTDVQLLEMARVFRLSTGRRLLYIYLPHLRPFLLSACTVAIGMAWKAGIAAEVIGIPEGSIGERLYEAKIYLSTGDLFAFTLVVVLCSVLLEKLFIWGLNQGFAWLERDR